MPLDLILDLGLGYVRSMLSVVELACFRLGKITVNMTKSSTLFYLYAHKYCSSGDNQVFRICCSNLVGIQI